MSTDTVIFLVGTINLAIGWFIAYVTYRRKEIALRVTHKQELRRAQSNFYLNGWNDGVESTLTMAASSIEKSSAHRPRH